MVPPIVKVCPSLSQLWFLLQIDKLSQLCEIPTTTPNPHPHSLPLPEPSTPIQALGLFFLPQHEILGKFQILRVIVSKGGAHNPLWIPVLLICSLLWLREPMLRAAHHTSISSLSTGVRILSSAPLS